MEIERRFHSMHQYEDKMLQKQALEAMPLALLEQRAQVKMRSLQKDVKKGVMADINISIQELLVLELLYWFKDMYFDWVDNPDCDYCGSQTEFSHMSADPKLLVDTNRAEMHKCRSCSKLTPFFRYQKLTILMETREGRCGEWASVFTLFCRALGWQTRLVFDETDHVWTEVYSIAQKRWLHCDPCENICDNPLIYENGWGKRLSYIIAYSHDDIQDVTWRYTSKHAKILENRKRCSETQLIQTIMALRQNALRQFSSARQNYLTLRLVNELVELMVEKKPNELEKQGRISGSLAWRLQRGETIETPNSNYVWRPTENEITLGQMIIRYNPVLDHYERVSNNSVTERIQKWQKGVFETKDVFRKEEKDWKMVYLCRKEGASNGEIKWRFEINHSETVIDQVTVDIISNVFENGDIEIKLCDEKSCILIQNSSSLTTDDLAGSTAFTISVLFKGGNGDCAWQHAQLFRHSTSGVINIFPFCVKITFKSKCKVQ